MRFKSLLLLLFIILACLEALGQVSDYSSKAFQLTSGKSWHSGSEDASSVMQVFSDGKSINFFIEVKDDILISNKNTDGSDHIELTLSMPKEHFPEGFSHLFHPYYYRSSNQVTRTHSPGLNHRFFSTLSQEVPSIDIGFLKNIITYPSRKVIESDTLTVPPIEYVSTARVDYGIVRYAFFPDGRPARLLNRAFFKELEDNLNLKLGNIEAGIEYSVDKRPNGYNLNIQITPQALGFVKAPQISSISTVVDVYDFDVKKGLASVLSSNTQGPVSNNKARNLETISFNKAINTNFSKAPDRVFHLTDFSPILVFTDKGWISTLVDADQLILGPFKTSPSLNEIAFDQAPFYYSFWREPGTSLNIEQLQIQKRFVNEAPRVIEFTLLGGQVFKGTRIQNRVQVLDTTYNSRPFLFPDGGTGIIIVENAMLHPQGWGDCGHCIQEQISIYRLTRSGSKKVLTAFQGEGKGDYFEVQDIKLSGFQVDRMDWVSPGSILVLQLHSEASGERKRIRVSWAEDGSQVVVELLP